MVIARNNVRIRGHGRQSVVFAHGYGCDQEVWQLLTPAFLADYRVVLFDHVGSGGSDLSAYSPERYSTLHAYAEDVLDVCEASCGDAPIFIGHSVGAIIGALAAARQPDYFARLVMLAPSPCYLDDGDYAGGFTRQEIEDLLGLLDRNRLSWSRLMAETMMGNPERPHLAADLAERFGRIDPVVARQFARVTFLSDHRAVLPAVGSETLVLQCAHDAIAPDAVGAYVQAHLPRGHLVRLKASGHCPHLSAPEETAAVIRSWLADNHFSRARA